MRAAWVYMPPFCRDGGTLFPSLILICNDGQLSAVDEQCGEADNIARSHYEYNVIFIGVFQDIIGNAGKILASAQADRAGNGCGELFGGYPALVFLAPCRVDIGNYHAVGIAECLGQLAEQTECTRVGVRLKYAPDLLAEGARSLEGRLYFGGMMSVVVVDLGSGCRFSAQLEAALCTVKTVET